MIEIIATLHKDKIALLYGTLPKEHSRVKEARGQLCVDTALVYHMELTPDPMYFTTPFICIILANKKTLN